MMKKKLLRVSRVALPLLAVMFAFTTSGPAVAGSSGSGDVKVPNASSAVTSSITAREMINLDGCSNANLTTQGLDAFVIDLRTDGKSASQLTINISESLGPINGVTGVTVWYLSSGCGLLLSHTVTEPINRMVKYGPYTFGDLSAAKWAIVSFHSGADVDFTWLAPSPV